MILARPAGGAHRSTCALVCLAGALTAAGPASAGLYRYDMPSAQTGPWAFDTQNSTLPGFVLVPPPTLGVGIASPSPISVQQEARLTLTFPAETTIFSAVALYDRFAGAPNSPWVASHLTTEAGLGPLNFGPTGGYQAVLVADGQPAGQRQVLARAISTIDQSGLAPGQTSTNPTALVARLREDVPPGFTAVAAPAAAAPLEVPSLAVSWVLDDATSGPGYIDALVVGVGPQPLSYPSAVNPTLMTGQASGGQRAVPGQATITLPSAPGRYTVVLRGWDVAGNVGYSAPIEVAYAPPPPAAASAGSRQPAAPAPPPAPGQVALPALPPGTAAVTLTRPRPDRRPGRPIALGVAYGARVTISGRVRVGSAGAADRPVEVSGPTGRTIARALTGRRGGFRLSIRARAAGTYRVLSGRGGPARLRLAVAPRISAPARLRVSGRRPIVVRALVRPARAHAGRLALVRWRPPGSRRWFLFGSVGRVGRDGRVAITHQVPLAGARAFRFRAQVLLPADSGRPAGRSRIITVSVTR